MQILLRLWLPGVHLFATKGANIRHARRRRRLPSQVVAERAFTSRPTLQRIEAGDHTVGIGIYAAVLQALGLLEGLGVLAEPSSGSRHRVRQSAATHRAAPAPKDRRWLTSIEIGGVCRQIDQGCTGTYAEACRSESLADWIGVHANLFRYLGGVPKFVVCDNLVIKARPHPEQGFRTCLGILSLARSYDNQARIERPADAAS